MSRIRELSLLLQGSELPLLRVLSLTLVPLPLPVLQVPLLLSPRLDPWIPLPQTQRVFLTCLHSEELNFQPLEH